jgi:hypothetical protein
MKKKFVKDHGEAPDYAPAAPFESAEPNFSYDQDDEEGGEDISSGEETARFVADMIVSLSDLARAAKLDLLAYLLDMARVEAEVQARQTETPFEDD